jgi:hypothetical protein
MLRFVNPRLHQALCPFTLRRIRSFMMRDFYRLQHRSVSASLAAVRREQSGRVQPYRYVAIVPHHHSVQIMGKCYGL